MSELKPITPEGLLLEENKRLSAEIERLRAENDALKEEIENDANLYGAELASYKARAESAERERNNLQKKFDVLHASWTKLRSKPIALYGSETSAALKEKGPEGGAGEDGTAA